MLPGPAGHSPALIWVSLAGLLASRARLCFPRRGIIAHCVKAKGVEVNGEAVELPGNHLATGATPCNALSNNTPTRLVGSSAVSTVCAFAAPSACWPSAKHRLELRGRPQKCLHYYFYLQHPQFGFMHLRLQTWFPLSIHIALNGREWLARQLDAAGIGYHREKQDRAKVNS
jgi:ribosome-binding ATPase